MAISKQKIVPHLWYDREAAEASDCYRSLFKNARPGEIVHYPAGMEPDREGTIMFTDFKLEGTWFAAMDSAREHGFGFNEAVSLMVNCEDQQEIDFYWEKLSADPEAEQCGWLKDKYGVSWQITPAVLGTMLQDPDPEKVSRVTQAFLKMKKFDLAALHAAYDGT